MKNERGMTLVELMIVVAILGILAAIATVAYGRYIRSAQIEKLRQYGSEISSGQERFRSRNNLYWNPPNSPGSYSANEDGFANLLDFSKQVPNDVEITVNAWTGDDGTCNICTGAPFDDTRAGYAVRIEKDFNTESTAKTTIVITTDTENPILLNEGE